MAKKAPPHAVATLTSFAAARELLRAPHRTSQAGFTAERIPQSMFAHRPILFDDGPEHDAHRRQLARFFAPRVLEEKHGTFISLQAHETVARARALGSCRIDAIALEYSVAVASRVVGLTHGRIDARARRLTRFFRQPPVVHTLPDHGRTTQQWIQAAWRALVPLATFYFADVRPAIRARRKLPADDIVSHLLASGYRSSEILMECLTYGTAGMVTTREFISACLWHLLNDDPLRASYVAAPESERKAILQELIRLKPPVSHLYRRVGETVTEAPDPAGDGCPFAAGTLVDIDVVVANRDREVLGENANELCPDRGLPASDRAGLSFGDGAHRCPGSALALLETDALLLALLAAGPEVVQAPTQHYDTLVEGYQLREFVVQFASEP